MTWKAYPSYKPSGVEWFGEIPSHWNVLALKRAVEPTRPITYGIVQCGPDYPDGVLYIRPVDMSDENGVKLKNLQRTSPKIAAAYSRSMIRPRDIIVSIGPSFGKVMITPTELDGANLTQGTARIAPGALMIPRFLFWALRSNLLWQTWDSFCSGATFRALTLEILEYCAFAVPSQGEQNAIASFLDRETAKIDALVEKKERLIELLQKKRTALITQAVTKGLDPNVPKKDSGIEWLGKIPAHWDIYSLRRRLFREIGSIKIGPFGSQLKLEFMIHEGFKVYGQEHVIAGDFGRGNKYVDTDKFEELAACEIRPNDLVVTMMGSSGRCAVVPEGIERGIMDSHLLRIRLMECNLDPKYLCLLINDSSYVRDQIETEGKGAIMHGLNSGIIKSILLAVPPLIEQQEILAFLDRETAKIDALAIKIQEAIDRLKEYRIALISAAVTGKIDVQDIGLTAQSRKR